MRLLVVDDESLTREGVIGAIDREGLGIEEIFQADDGASGLRSALENQPDIVLCDVRMPRMDGITMLEKIRKTIPGIVAVFMSGYSDKEYLKAAIQLQAVDYIEKPFEIKELNEVLKRAAEQCRWVKLQAIADEAQETATASRLAYRFTMPYQSNREEVDSLCSQLCDHYGHDKFKYVSTFIVRLRDVPDEPNVISNLHEALHGFLKPMHLHVIYTEKKSYHIIFHIYGDLEPAESTIMLIAQELKKLLSALGDYYIAVGQTVCGKENVYKSYASAVILLQGSFFTNIGTVLTDRLFESLALVSSDEIRNAFNDFRMAIDENDYAATGAPLEIFKKLEMSRGLMPNQLKALYYDMFILLYTVRKRRGLSTDLTLENQETIMDVMEKCFCFKQLNDMLAEKVRDFFADSDEQNEDNPTIRLIRDYIAENYANPDLSVKFISDHAGLSASYACTFFKNETGTTLNQYITDFRMKKAKQLLSDPRNRVGEISAKVGYNDGNYFAKSFRKYMGLSPSEYREQVIRK